MAFYLISYDLRKPDFDYQDLYDELSSLGAKHVQDSVWALCSQSSATTVFNSLWSNMHNQKDRLLVGEMGSNWKSENGLTKIKAYKEACG